MESDNVLRITVKQALRRSLGGTSSFVVCAACSTFRPMGFYLDLL